MLIKVTRAFLKGGVVQEVGSRLEVDIHLARELIATGKAEAAQALPVQSGPMTTESVPTLVQGKGKKGKSHVGE